MRNRFSSFMNKSIWVTVILFVLRCGFSWKDIIENVSVYDLYGYAGEAISVSAILMTVYEKWLWRLMPLKDVPALARVYSGTLKSSYDNIERKATLKILSSCALIFPMVALWEGADTESIVNRVATGISNAAAIFATVSIVGFFNARSICPKCAGLIPALNDNSSWLMCCSFRKSRMR